MLGMYFAILATDALQSAFNRGYRAAMYQVRHRHVTRRIRWFKVTNRDGTVTLVGRVGPLMFKSTCEANGKALSKAAAQIIDSFIEAAENGLLP